MEKTSTRAAGVGLQQLAQQFQPAESRHVEIQDRQPGPFAFLQASAGAAIVGLQNHGAPGT